MEKQSRFDKIAKFQNSTLNFEKDLKQCSFVFLFSNLVSFDIILFKRSNTQVGPSGGSNQDAYSNVNELREYEKRIAEPGKLGGRTETKKTSSSSGHDVTAGGATSSRRGRGSGGNGPRILSVLSTDSDSVESGDRVGGESPSDEQAELEKKEAEDSELKQKRASGNGATESRGATETDSSAIDPELSGLIKPSSRSLFHNSDGYVPPQGRETMSPIMQSVLGIADAVEFACPSRLQRTSEQVESSHLDLSWSKEPPIKLTLPKDTTDKLLSDAQTFLSKSHETIPEIICRRSSINELSIQVGDDRISCGLQNFEDPRFIDVFKIPAEIFTTFVGHALRATADDAAHVAVDLPADVLTICSQCGRTLAVRCQVELPRQSPDSVTVDLSEEPDRIDRFPKSSHELIFQSKCECCKGKCECCKPRANVFPPILPPPRADRFHCLSCNDKVSDAYEETLS